MTLPAALNDREYQKFIDIAPGETAVRISGTNFSGTFTISGLNTAGRVSIVTVNDTTWTALPSGMSALSDRNAMAIQNQSAFNIKVNYSDSVVGWVGMKIPPDGERFYDIQPGIAVYVKAEPGAGSVDIAVEELA